MNQRLKLYFYFCLIFGMFSISSLADVFQHAVSPQQDGSFKNKIPQPSFFKADFVQKKKIQGLNKELISSGKVLFVKNRGVLWQVQKPFVNVLVFNKSKVNQFNTQKQKKVVSSSKHPMFRRISNILNAAFAGDYKQLDKKFKLYFHETSSFWELGLKPKSHSKANSLNNFMNSMTIRGSQTLEEVVIQEKDGGSTRIVFSNVQIKPQGLTAEEEEYLAL